MHPTRHDGSDHAVPTALTGFQTVSSTISVVHESECRPVPNQVLDQTSQLGGPHRLLQKSEPGNFCLFSYIHIRVPTDQAGGNGSSNNCVQRTNSLNAVYPATQSKVTDDDVGRMILLTLITRRLCSVSRHHSTTPRSQQTRKAVSAQCVVFDQQYAQTVEARLCPQFVRV